MNVFAWGHCPPEQGSKIPFHVVDTAWYSRDFPFVHRILGLFANIGLRPLPDNGILARAVGRLHHTNIDLVELLLNLGVVADSKESDDDPTALHLAVLNHDLPVVRTLLEAGAAINLLWMKQSILQTALKHWSDCKKGWVRVIINAWRLLENRFGFDCVSPELQLLEFQDVYYKADYNKAPWRPCLETLVRIWLLTCKKTRRAAQW